MTADAIKHQLTDIFRDVFNDPTLEITDEMTADDVDGWDSLTHINMILGVEQGFGIRFSIKDVRAMRNVGELVQAIAKKRAN
ncbi:acyl carrier protein [Novosphingobium sp. FSW06-99]|uniref:acyl carrier protein n=1 Tax=Novosphingobium sp. FSW06-99 TaxID=1739113 RepID=UPI00076DC537|nr:acyl carrier protein [Novosphingobium sp. FSW06-99]KUR75718.1 acyl carrier protein [Novosphingobium sp. FSW06-99]